MDKDWLVKELAEEQAKSMSLWKKILIAVGVVAVLGGVTVAATQGKTPTKNTAQTGGSTPAVAASDPSNGLTPPTVNLPSTPDTSLTIPNPSTSTSPSIYEAPSSTYTYTPDTGPAYTPSSTPTSTWTPPNCSAFLASEQPLLQQISAINAEIAQVPQKVAAQSAGYGATASQIQNEENSLYQQYNAQLQSDTDQLNALKGQNPQCS